MSEENATAQEDSEQHIQASPLKIGRKSVTTKAFLSAIDKIRRAPTPPGNFKKNPQKYEKKLNHRKISKKNPPKNISKKLSQLKVQRNFPQ
jgi:hypothetical protein